MKKQSSNEFRKKLMPTIYSIQCELNQNVGTFDAFNGPNDYIQNGNICVSIQLGEHPRTFVEMN